MDMFARLKPSRSWLKPSRSSLEPSRSWIGAERSSLAIARSWLAPARFCVLALGVVALTCACSTEQKTQQAAPPPPSTSPTQQLPLGCLPDIDMDAVLQHTRVLSSDAYEGRAPGTRGEELSVRYLEDQFRRAGLKPGNTDGTYVQKVPLVGITPAPAPLVFKKDGQQETLKWKDDVVAWTKHVAPSAEIKDSDLVFVGYGVVAPEFNWDDYKGVDVKGKTLVMLINDPAVPNPSNPNELDPKTFGGNAMTYYGRWTYKYEIGQQKGAAGVLIVHETGPAGYGFNVVQGKTGEQFDLVTPDKNMSRAAIEGWITLDKAKALMKMAGQDFDQLKAQAATREFTPVPLGVTASMSIKNKLRTIDSRNVIGRFDGADPRLKNEYVVYTAHWDHFGRSAEGIFHGAEDDALGCAALIEMARAFGKVSPPPRRSILFLAVTAEEQGLLGSQYYATTPIYPLTKTAANINMDSWNVHGRTKDLTLIGHGASDLDDYAAAAAAEQGRVVHADAEPEKGFYYRSDHFNFAKEGVPALNPDAGTDFIGQPPGYAKKVRDEWNAERYHTPKDVVLPTWNLDGAREDLKVLFAVGYRVAQADNMPEWKPGNEFRAKREESLRPR